MGGEGRVAKRSANQARDGRKECVLSGGLDAALQGRPKRVCNGA